VEASFFLPVVSLGIPGAWRGARHSPEGEGPPLLWLPLRVLSSGSCYGCCFRLRCLQRASPIPAAVVPKSRSVVGSGTGSS
jgi:hypothetical protein